MARYGNRRRRATKARTTRRARSTGWGNRRSRSAAPRRGRVSRARTRSTRRSGGAQRIQIELIQPGASPMENMVKQMFSRKQLAADKGGSSPPPRTKSAF